jgi:ABC-type branched-subunit amino acid transport system ATPase component
MAEPETATHDDAADDASAGFERVDDGLRAGFERVDDETPADEARRTGRHAESSAAFPAAFPAAFERFEEMPRPDARDQGPLLDVRGVTKRFGGITAVDALDLAVTAGEIIGIIGPNGAGKSTLFDCVSGFCRPDAGRVRFAGRDVTRVAPHHATRAGMVRTFQVADALDRLTVRDNLMLAPPLQRGERLWGALRARRNRRDNIQIAFRADSVLGAVGLTAHEGALAGTLGSGERKQLDLARALMTEPRLVLLDEPLAGVPPEVHGQVLGRISRLRDEGVTFVIAEHDLDAVLRACDRILVMANGRLVAHGTPRAIRHDPRVQEAYFGP